MHSPATKQEKERTSLVRFHPNLRVVVDHNMEDVIVANNIVEWRGSVYSRSSRTVQQQGLFVCAIFTNVLASLKDLLFRTSELTYLLFAQAASTLAARPYYVHTSERLNLVRRLNLFARSPINMCVCV